MRDFTDLRNILDFLEEHEDFPIPSNLKPLNGEYAVYVWESDGDKAKAEIGRLARLLRKCDKSADNGYLKVARPFGEASLSVKVSQAATCEKIVVGTKRETVPVYGEVTYVEKDVEQVEWVCPDSLLSGTQRA